jgi:putative spermidine/putrescine transport system substrate-binding protein
MKKLLAKHLLTLATIGLVSLATNVKAEDTLVVSSYGFNKQKFRDILFDPFEKICGCKIVVEGGNNAARMTKLEAQGGKGKYDLAVFADFAAIQAKEKGLTQAIDVSKISNYSKVFDFAKDPIGENFGIGYTFYSTSIVYRSDKIDNISSWSDLWGDQLKGRVAIPNITTTQGPLTLFMANKALKGSDDDFTNALDQLATSKDNFVTFYNRSSELISLFAQDEVWAAPVGRFAWGRLKKANPSLKWSIPSEGQTGGMNVMVIPKGTKHVDLVHQLIDFWLSTPIQTALAEQLVDSPSNSEAKVSEAKAELLTYGDEQVGAINFLNPEKIIRNRAAWVKTWNENIAN